MTQHTHASVRMWRAERSISSSRPALADITATRLGQGWHGPTQARHRIYLSAVAAGGNDATTGPGPFLIAAVPALLLFTVALTLVPTRLAARQPAIEALRGDA